MQWGRSFFYVGTWLGALAKVNAGGLGIVD